MNDPKWQVVEEDRLWYSLGGIDGRHTYVAFRIGEYGPDCYPWLLVRDDGYQTRVTNAPRCTQIAELVEEYGVTATIDLSNGKTHTQVLMTLGAN